MEYHIESVSLPLDWEQIESLAVEQYCWGGDYRPEVQAKMLFVPDKGFAVKMDCKEEKPRAVFTKNNELVCQDSCMECFINFNPADSDSGYINFEMNANGVLYSSYGTDRFDRKFLCDLGVTEPQVKICKIRGHWSVELFISLEIIERIYGDRQFKKGALLKGNFYKCGDHTAVPHYGSWTVIDNKEPDFHLSAFFGTLVID